MQAGKLLAAIWHYVVLPILQLIRRAMAYFAAKAPGIFYSLWLHLFLVLLVVGMPPGCGRAPLEEQAIVVELLPISDATNIKPKEQKQKKKEKKKEPKKKPPKPKPKPKVKPKPKPKPVAKPKPKKKVPPKPKEKPKPKEDDFDTVLKSVEELSANQDKQQKKQQSPDYDAAAPLSLSEIDAIKYQISKCWSIPAGARGAETISVLLYIALQKDGSVTKVSVVDKRRYGDPNEQFFRAAADAARRAVLQCSPLKNLPIKKYNSWREIELNFDPSELLY